MDTSDPVPFLLVTANVGSVFEDPTRLLKPWINEFLNKITMLKPMFIGLHMQEVGGKTYEKSMEYVQEFIKILCKSNELEEYNRIRIYLDEDFTSAEHFTALGNLYFVSKSLQAVKMWNFLTHEWEQVDGKSIHTGNIEAVATKEKSKFPQHFFPECKWSRKGFLRTRWEISGTVVDMVNIHLFHDASNLAACEESPSVYCKSRRRALVHTLERFHKDSINRIAPYFVFGDFNFRCDTEGVIKKLTEDLSVHRIMNVKNDHTKVQYRNDNGTNVLTVGKKEFNHIDHQTKFKESWLQQFDRELEPLKEVLVEYPITFSPTYPYEEEPSLPNNYMLTRCPAWCDRIFMSPAAKDIIVDNNFSSKDYNTIGEDLCMGDHKPVYLNIRLKVYQGTIQCSCTLHANSNFKQPYSDALSNYRLSTKLSKCLYSSNNFHKLLLDSLKMNNISSRNCLSSSIMSVSSSLPSAISIKNNNDGDDDVNNVQHQQHLQQQNVLSISKGKSRPKININLTLTDAENENICMCSLLYANTSSTSSTTTTTSTSKTTTILNDNDYILIDETMDGQICTQCRHIIKQQPTEHRKALISKRLELENDIIVNRVDTHYLSLCTYPGKYGDPYTPESVESHSPQPEIQDESINLLEINQNSSSTTLNDNVHHNHHHMNKSILQQTTMMPTSSSIASASAASKAVSPSQLKSRLISLQRPNVGVVSDINSSNCSGGGGDGVLTHKDSNHSCSASIIIDDTTKNRKCFRCGLCDIL